MEKLKRGQKLCKKCNTVNGVRSFNCKNCNNPFEMKKARKTVIINGVVKVRKNFVSDYKSLVKGDRIKVLKGSGPYHTDDAGNKTYLGSKGKYTVDRVMDDGIMVSSQYGSHEFLYMGPVMTSPMLDTLTRAPFKIILLKKRPEDE